MHVLQKGSAVARRWVLLLVALQLCGVAAGAIGWAPSGGLDDTPAAVRAVAVAGLTAPTPATCHVAHAARAIAENLRGSAVRAQGAGSSSSHGAAPVVQVADLPAAVTPRPTEQWSVAVAAWRLGTSRAVRSDVDVRGPPGSGVVLSVVPPTLPAG